MTEFTSAASYLSVLPFLVHLLKSLFRGLVYLYFFYGCCVQSSPWPKSVTESCLKSRNNFCKSILIARIHSAINLFKKPKLQSCWKSVQNENNNLLYFYYLRLWFPPPLWQFTSLTDCRMEKNFFNFCAAFLRHPFVLSAVVLQAE